MAMRWPKEMNLYGKIDSNTSWYIKAISQAERAYKDKSFQTLENIATAVLSFSLTVESLLLTAKFIDSVEHATERKPLAMFLALSEPTRAKVEETYEKYKLENMKADRLPAFRIFFGIEARAFYDAGDPDGIIDVLEMHNDAYSTWRRIDEGSECTVYEYNFGYMDAFYRALRDTLFVLADKILERRRAQAPPGGSDLR
ncbi:hypothetical protein [Pontibacter pamirensis]|uniref:hypothetical protein n=1 Tax=Pontibacter pamirensis TaxID=2562824 RepID=UPI001389F9EB|nr:hypothetical protein [Pontibacter pamirensis]